MALDKDQIKISNEVIKRLSQSYFGYVSLMQNPVRDKSFELWLTDVRE